MNLTRKYKTYKKAVHLESLRKSCIPYAHGDVLELCSGIGADFEYYKFYTIRSITAVDKNIHHLNFSKTILTPYSIEKFKFIEDDVRHFLSTSNTYDSIIFPLCLCVFDNPMEVLQKAVQNLRPGGLIISFQHGSSKFKLIALIQKLMDQFHRKKYGCHASGNYNAIFKQIDELSKIESYTKYLGIFQVDIYKKL